LNSKFLFFAFKELAHYKRLLHFFNTPILTQKRTPINGSVSLQADEIQCFFSFNARQNWTGTFAFLHCPDSGSQSLESLQPFQQWHRTPLPARLPALVGTTRLPALF